jgi:hypothetical protein
VSPRTRAEIDAAPALVRQLWTVSPAAAVQHVADRRTFAEVLAAAADTDADRQVAVALHLAADRAETELRWLCDAPGEVAAVFAEILDRLGLPSGWVRR